MPNLDRFVLILLLALCGSVLHAQQAAAPASASSSPSPEQTLKGLQHQLDDIKQGMADKKRGKSLGDLRNEAVDLHDRASQLAEDLASGEKSLQAQLSVLGLPPIKGAPPEASEVRQKRRWTAARPAWMPSSSRPSCWRRRRCKRPRRSPTCAATTSRRGWPRAPPRC